MTVGVTNEWIAGQVVFVTGRADGARAQERRSDGPHSSARSRIVVASADHLADGSDFSTDAQRATSLFMSLQGLGRSREEEHGKDG